MTKLFYDYLENSFSRFIKLSLFTAIESVSVQAFDFFVFSTFGAFHSHPSHFDFYEKEKEINNIR